MRRLNKSVLAGGVVYPAGASGPDVEAAVTNPAHWDGPAAHEAAEPDQDASTLPTDASDDAPDPAPTDVDETPEDEAAGATAEPVEEEPAEESKPRTTRTRKSTSSRKARES